MNSSLLFRSVEIGLLVASILGSASPTGASQAPHQPPPPTHGPGGSDYSSQQVIATPVDRGVTSYILYEPARPSPASAPVVVFLQGYGSISPDSYLAWINHIVKKGNIVIYPIYLLDNNFTQNALTAVQQALVELQRGQHVRPELNHFALVGHSCGSVVAANLAAIALRNGLPVPSVLMPTSPGCNTQYEDYSRIPVSTRMVIMVPESDEQNTFATYLWNHTSQIPMTDRDTLTLRSDSYGQPDLTADHNTPVTGINGSMTDTLDYYGTWKIFDALETCAWSNRDCSYALGGGPNQIGMGRWSDGRPVNTMFESKSP